MVRHWKELELADFTLVRSTGKLTITAKIQTQAMAFLQLLIVHTDRDLMGYTMTMNLYISGAKKYIQFRPVQFLQ